MKNWIRVEDKLPKNGERVLIYKDGFYDVLTYEGDKFYQIAAGGTFYVTITHWMPLPEPPEENIRGDD